MAIGGKGKGTARGMMGEIMPPIDVDNEGLLDELKKRIKKGPMTMVLVYAPWCGHCQTYKPMYEQFENNPNRSIQIARVRDDMIEKANITNAKIEGYPAVILVNNKNTVVEEIADNRNVEKMNSIVENAGISKTNMSTGPETITKMNQRNVGSMNTSISDKNASKINRNNVINDVANEMNRPVVTRPIDIPNENVDSKKKKDSLVYGGGCGCPFSRMSGGSKSTVGGSAGLYGLLTSVVNESLPAVALLGSAVYLASKTKKTKSKIIKKTKSKKTRKTKSRKQ